MNIKRIASLTLTIVMLFSFCACGEKKNTIIIQKAPFDSETVYDIPESKVLAAAGDYTLSLNGKYGFPVLEKNGCERVWDLSPTGFLDGWNYEYGIPVSASSLFLKYYDPEYDAFFTANSSDAVKSGRVKFDEIDNGIKITYFFDELEVSVPVSYTVNEEGLLVRVLPEEIDENDFPVISVSVAPFLCSVENEKNDNRYLFVPSGSGALMYTDNRGEIRNYEEEVYGDDLARDKKWNYTNSGQIYLPVFGAVDDGNAIYGIIKSGDQSSSVGAYAGDKSAGRSGVYPVFNIRSYNTVEINVGGTTGLKKFLRLADKRNSAAFEVQYSVLTGEDASYSGIARAYREYLGLESGTANKTVNITLLGGFMLNKSLLGIPYTKFNATTTFKDAEKIVTELYKANKTPMNIRLAGYGKTGLDITKLAGGFGFNGALGSKNDIAAFKAALNSSGSYCYTDYDVLKLSKSGGGYSTRGDTAVDITDYRVKLYSFDIALRNVDATKKSLYLLSRSRIGDAVDDALKAGKKAGLGGVSFETLGYSAYSDFSGTGYYGKGNMTSDVTAALKKVNESGLRLATVSPNAYAAAVSDYIDCIPTVSSNLSCLDVDIPFYGMVFSGCKENAVAVNLSSEPRKAFLNSLKTGSGLSFFISYDLGEAPVEKNGLYISSDYASNKGLINGFINSSEDFFSAVSGISVEKYEILDTGFSKTVFENGTVLYVNESAYEKSAEGVTVKAMDYQWR